MLSATPKLPTGRVARLRSAWVLALIFCFVLPTLAVDPGLSGPALETFRQAKARHQEQPGNLEAGWQFARACFDLAEFSTNRTERAAIAEQGIAAAKQAVSQNSNSAPAHYYLGMDLAQLARTRGLSALHIVDQMEREFSRARALDPQIDYAGPDRNLGLLYRDAPSIGSIGSRSKARLHLQQAVALAPADPENRLNLIETYLKWGDRPDAQKEFKALEESWAAARAQFTGPAWAASWADWEARREKLSKKLGEK